MLVWLNIPSDICYSIAYKNAGCKLYLSASSAKTKCHRLAGLKDRNLVFHSPGAGSPRPACWQGWFLLVPLSVASHVLLPMCANSWCLSMCPNFLFLWGHWSYWIRAILTASSNSITSLKALSSDTVTHEVLQVRVPTFNFRGGGYNSAYNMSQLQIFYLPLKGHEPS